MIISLSAKPIRLKPCSSGLSMFIYTFPPHVSGRAASPPPTSPSSTPATHPFVRSPTAAGCRGSKGEQSQALKDRDPRLLVSSVQLLGCHLPGALEGPNSSWDVAFRAKAKSQMCQVENPGGTSARPSVHLHSIIIAYNRKAPLKT